ncbi:MAG: D-Ala-D-Ala carboxypeptidase family metallohydrolase [Actinomycetota bacterium]|nr:D-Ala-D-Ala carboxypeptidase family metallohydrolase [Actinomycetota bacterium]
MAKSTLRRAPWLLAAALSCALAVAPAAHAYDFTRPLKRGDEGPDVRALQTRIAGWFPRADQTEMGIDGAFGRKTARAVKAFERFHDMKVDGVAGRSVFAALNEIEDDDGSTAHFDWSEFVQNRNPGCSAKANAYAGTFGGGMVAPVVVKRNVRRLMWRLEALRVKAGAHPIGINSGYRSVAYNDCIGGARVSQHMYGTAADNRVAEVDNRTSRELAKSTQFSGVGCYSSLSHNHLDIRVENAGSPTTQFWWWPKTDPKGRHLADDGLPCWGETVRKNVALTRVTASVLRSVAAAVPGAGSIVPGAAEVEAFEAAGETEDLKGLD